MKKYAYIWGIVIVVGFILYFLFFGQPKMPEAPIDGTSNVATTSLNSGNIESPSSKAADRKMGPVFTLENYQGGVVRFSDYAGRPTVINSWAAWCPFCRKELPDLAAAQREFGDQVTIIAIDRAESLRTAKKYSDELGVSDQLIFLLDPNDSFYRSIGGFSMPETIFVNAAGEIIHHKRGVMELDEIREKIYDIL